MINNSLPRRAILGGGLGLGAATLLPGCGPAAGGAPGGQESGPLTLPAYQPPDPIDGASISDVPGVSPAYPKWPAEMKASVDAPPGSGGHFRSLAPTWSTAPPPVAQNQWLQELNRRLNVTLEPNTTADYYAAIGPVIASGDLPELIWVEWGESPTMLQAIEQGALTDLTPHLSGDKINSYPNLAKLPTYAWQASALFGKLWAVPNCLSLINQFDVWRADWAEKLGYGQPPEDAAGLLEILTAATRDNPSPNGAAWALGSFDRGFVLASELYAVPTGWREQDGKLVCNIETPEYLEALDYTLSLIKAGVFHPDAKAMNGTKERQLYAEGRLMFAMPSLDLYFGNGITGIRGDLRKLDPGARSEFFPTPGADGRDPNPGGSGTGFFGGGAIPATVGSDPAKVQELLKIMNFWAAPFGTEEFLFMHFGIEGRHFTFDKAGQPTPVDDPAVLSELNANVMCTPTYQYYPADPQTALEAQRILARNVPLAQPNPTQGLVSATDQRRGATLDTIILDGRNKILAEGGSTADFAAVVEDWRKQGGDQVRDEYAKALAAR